MNNFIQDCIKGKAKPKDIDNYIDHWHNNDPEGLELYQFLGMTKKEYMTWVMDDSKLNEIIKAHRNGK